MVLLIHTTRFLLASTLLFSGVPTWQHSHAAGDQSHQHGHVHGAEHSHDGMTESHAHLHITLLGVDFNLPIESEDNDSQEAQIKFLVATPPTTDATHTDAIPLSALAQAILTSVESVQIVPTFRCITASAAPLSDNARHERSGVLLI